MTAVGLALSACSTTKDEAGAPTVAQVATVAPPASEPPTPTEPADSVVETTETVTVETDPVPATEPPPSTVAAIVDPRAPGVTDDKIMVGVTYPFLSEGLRSILGIADHGSYEEAYGAEFDAINAAGGIHGRMIEATIIGIDPQAEEAAPAACTALTEDSPTFVSLGFFNGDDMLCHIDLHESMVIGGEITAARLAQAKAPWFSIGQSSDLTGDAIAGLAGSGELSADKLAVVGSVGDEAVFDSLIEPIFEANGIAPSVVAYIDTNLPDSNAVFDNAETIAERFSAEGAEQVLVLGNAGLFFGTALARTEYRPQLIFSDQNAARGYATGEGNDVSLLDGALTAGGYDNSDTFLTIGGATAECVARQQAIGRVLKHASDRADDEASLQTSSFEACRHVALLAAILDAAGPELNYGTFATAGQSLGEIDMPGYPQAWFYGPGSSNDGDPPVFLYDWDAAAAEFIVREG